MPHELPGKMVLAPIRAGGTRLPLCQSRILLGSCTSACSSACRRTGSVSPCSWSRVRRLQKRTGNILYALRIIVCGMRALINQLSTCTVRDERALL